MKIEVRGVEKLSFRERQVVALKETGLSNDQVAKRLGISASTVATLFNRARMKGYEVVIIIPGSSLGVYQAGDHEENN
ncbi:MAG: LuxR C-terminal-related transcriptional regulator [Peptococcaceae bacterium]|nr:LuxR C-terminal-related transcriptional regulator [Peptococcaceae bacterium]